MGLRCAYAATISIVDQANDIRCSLWQDLRLLPTCISAISLFITLLSTILLRRSHTEDRVLGFHAHITALGGTAIYGFRLARAICVYSLLGFYTYDVAQTHLDPALKADIQRLLIFLTYVSTDHSERTQIN